MKAGDLKRAMAIQAVITPLKDAVYGAGEPTGEAHARMKAGMVLAGVLEQRRRSPADRGARRARDGGAARGRRAGGPVSPRQELEQHALTTQGGPP